MQKFSSFVTDDRGNVVAGATIAFTNYPTGTAAAIYRDNGINLIAGNTVTSDSSGYYEIYAANGHYSRTISGPRLTTRTFTDFELYDSVDDTAIAASSGSGLIGHIASGTGAVATTVQAKLRESVSVKDFGAVGDGTTSDNTSFTNAYNEAAAASTINIGSGNFASVALTGSKAVLWKCDGSLNGAGTAPLSLPGTVETFFDRRKLVAQYQTTATDYSVMQVQRATTHSGGAAGYVNSGFRVNTTVGAGVTNYEWALIGSVDNYATAGENVGVYGQAYQRATGPTWGGTMEARDLRNTANTLGSLIGLEVDCFANGTDSNNTRGGIDVSIGKGTAGGSQCEAYFGVRVGPTNGDSAQGRVKVSYLASGDTDCAFDASTCTFSASGPAFKMAINHYFSFTATNDRTMGYTSSGLLYRVSGVTKWACDDTGITNQSGVIKINAVQVVTARRTGFTNQMTGTANQATAYDTATITLVQLAERVKALQDAMTTHGLIGP